jgi:hypothetical protein
VLCKFIILINNKMEKEFLLGLSNNGEVINNDEEFRIDLS